MFLKMRKRPPSKQGDSKIMKSVEDFLSTSSIHGLAQISRSPSECINKIWLLIVSIGFLSTFLMAFMCSQDWTEEPTSTSVMQIPIEHIIFPAVTICPLGQLNQEHQEKEETVDYMSLIQNCSFNKNNKNTGNVCNRIQEIHNENGVCLTINNIDISINSSMSPEKVTGVGYENSLRLLLNATCNGKKLKYRAFISEVGTTVSKVFFDIDPMYEGQQTFHIHGIHYVQASEKFKTWNEDNKICYFPHQRKLRYFNSYLQDNCKRECAWNRSIELCGCAPRELHLYDVKECDDFGKSCWSGVREKFSINDLDKTDCDCKNNCEMTHFFFSLIREPMKEDKILPLLFYFDTHIITQVKVNVKHTFFDKLSAIGGTLGLFCGVSVISILELFYYLIIFLKRLVADKKKKEEETKSEKFILKVTEAI